MGSARYAYLNTRVSLFVGRLLPRERLDALMVQPSVELPDAGDISAFFDPDGPDPARLEQTLLMHIRNDFQVLARPVRPKERALLTYGFLWFELMNLKAIIRGKLSGLPEKTVREQILDLGAFATLPVDELLRAEDAAEMLRRLEATVYSDIARQARRIYEERKDLFAVDAAIDRRYFAQLLSRVRNLGGSEQSAAEDLVGRVLDRFNLAWLLRYRFAYNLLPAESYYLLPPAGRLLSAERLQVLAQLGSLEEVVEALPTELKERLAGVTSISEADNRLDQMMLDAAAKALEDARRPVARAFAYLVAREGEMRRLIAIVKGRRLGLPTDLVRFAANLEPA